jgi:hypothetical protein
MLGSEGIELEEKRSFARHFRCPCDLVVRSERKVVLAADFACDNRFKVLILTAIRRYVMMRMV